MPRKPPPLCAPAPVVLRERDESRRSKSHLAARSIVIENPTWPQIEAAILRLDNRGFTDVSLEMSSGADRTSIGVSGGNEGRVVVCVARPDDPKWDQDFRHVVDHQWRDGEFVQVIGGQASGLPAFLSVPRDVAIQAARYFFERRALDPSLSWEVP